MIKEVKNNNLEIESYSEPKLDLNILKHRSSGKTSSGIVLGYLKKTYKKIPLEYTKLLENIYKDIRNLETTEQFKANQWRGKSGVTYQIKPDYVISLRYRKKDPESKPELVKTEMSKEQINRVRWAINNLNGEWFGKYRKEKKLIETSSVAEKVYNNDWKKIFANRKQHIILVEILNYLEYKQEIKYHRSGKVEVLNQEKI